MTQKYNLLLVDDEENILSALQRIFRGDETLEIITASSAQDALQKIANVSVDVVISDQRMPGMRGAELLQEIKARYPDSIRFLLSGYADIEAIISAINEGDIYRFIKKPWDNVELKNMVKQSLEQRTISRIISEAVFRAKRIIGVSSDIKVDSSSDKRSLNISLSDSSKIIPPESILRLIDFIVGTMEAEGKLDKAGFSGGTFDKKEGKVVLSVDLAKDIKLNIEFPSAKK